MPRTINCAQCGVELTTNSAKQKCCSRRCAMNHKATHGHSQHGKLSLTYISWRDMKRRCLRSSCAEWKHYGGRGIALDPRWWEFKNFLEDMGRRPSSDHSIDRIDNDGNYEPSNCRWATRSEQARNRRSSRFLEFGGRRITLAEWAEEIGIDKRTLHIRLKAGWSIERALTEPLRGFASKSGKEPKPATIFVHPPF